MRKIFLNIRLHQWNFDLTQKVPKRTLLYNILKFRFLNLILFFPTILMSSFPD